MKAQVTENAAGLHFEITQSGELSDPDLVANLLALADWQESDDLAAILRTAATRLNALATQCLTDAEREAIEWAAYAAEKWYENTAAATRRELREWHGNPIYTRSITLRELLERSP
jgi:hypothetical protein